MWKWIWIWFNRFVFISLHNCTYVLIIITHKIIVNVQLKPLCGNLRKNPFIEMIFSQCSIGTYYKTITSVSSWKLQSSTNQGLCNIETSNLDGETNLKIKQAVGEKHIHYRLMNLEMNSHLITNYNSNWNQKLCVLHIGWYKFAILRLYYI